MKRTRNQLWSGRYKFDARMDALRAKRRRVDRQFHACREVLAECVPDWLNRLVTSGRLQYFYVEHTRRAVQCFPCDSKWVIEEDWECTVQFDGAPEEQFSSIRYLDDEEDWSHDFKLPEKRSIRDYRPSFPSLWKALLAVNKSNNMAALAALAFLCFQDAHKESDCDKSTGSMRDALQHIFPDSSDLSGLFLCRLHELFPLLPDFDDM